jgi:DME family drug/metabolite transporter
MLAVLLASVLWGTTGTVAHQLPPEKSQLLVGLSTFGFGGLVLLTLDARAPGELIRDPTTRLLLFAAVLGVVSYASMYYVSMSLVGVAVGNALALGSGPVFAAILERVVERRPVRGDWAVATALTVLGVSFLAVGARSSSEGGSLLGVLLGLGAGFGYAAYTWAGARMIGSGHGSRSVMAAIFGMAAIVLVPIFLLSHPGPLLSEGGWLVLAYLAVIPMACAYLLFGYGLRALPASTATTLALAEPVVATLLAVSVLDERLTGLSWLGLGLIIAGIVLVALTESRQVPY